MTMTRANIMAQIRDHLPFGADSRCKFTEESMLSDLGISSSHLLALLLSLQRAHELDVDRISMSTMPITVGDLITVVQRGMATGQWNFRRRE
jgi:hypothetical protein